VSTLPADFGFAPRTAFVSELAERLRHKLLPGTPGTTDAAELFLLALPTPFDAQWLALRAHNVSGVARARIRAAIWGALAPCAAQLLHPAPGHPPAAKRAGLTRYDAPNLPRATRRHLEGHAGSLGQAASAARPGSRSTRQRSPLI